MNSVARQWFTRFAVRYPLRNERERLVVRDHLGSLPAARRTVSIRSASHSAHAETPSPFVALILRSEPWVERSHTPSKSASSKSNTDIVSYLLRMTASEIWKMFRVLVGLVVPLWYREDHDFRVLALVELRRAHEVAHVPTMMRSSASRSRALTARWIMSLSRWQAPPY